LQARNAGVQPLFGSHAAACAVPIEKKGSRSANLRKPQLRELQRACKILSPPLVVNRELLASGCAIALVSHKFVPQCRGLVMLAAALGQ